MMTSTVRLVWEVKKGADWRNKSKDCFFFEKIRRARSELMGAA